MYVWPLGENPTLSKRSKSHTVQTLYGLLVILSALQDDPCRLRIAHAHCLQFERYGMVVMSHIREASKVTVNSSHFHPAHQHYTDEAHKAETVPYACIFMDMVETEFLEQQEIKPWMWLRYIDDIFFVWLEGED